jgi:hypothetical protein
MKMITAVLLIGLVLMPWVSCTQDTFVDLRGMVVPARVDLVVGFANQEVRVFVNDQLSYSAVLGSSEPLSGPIAQFETMIPRGSNWIVVEYRLSTSGGAFARRSAQVNVGDSERYYLGLILQGAVLKINIQDTPLYYL